MTVDEGVEGGGVCGTDAAEGGIPDGAVGVDGVLRLKNVGNGGGGGRGGIESSSTETKKKSFKQAPI